MMAKIFTKSFLKSKVFHLGVGGLFLFAFGITMVFYGFPKIMKCLIRKDSILKDGTDGYSFWKNPPIPITFKVYLFNISNPEEVAQGSQPKLKEIGPYVYKKHLERHNIRPEGDTLTYDMKNIYLFDQEASGDLKESDEVTILHIPLVGMANTVKQIFPAGLLGVNKMIPDLFGPLETPFLTATVGEILFDGIFINCTSSKVSMICKAIKAKLPPTVRESEDEPGYLSSFFYHLNDTLEGPYVINTGENDINKIGEILSYQNESTAGVWEGSCDNLRGSDTTIFPPIEMSNPQKKIHIFQPDLCRSVYAEFKGIKTVFDLPAYRYEGTYKLLQSGINNTENACYCDSNWSGIYDGCSLNGVLDLNLCQGAPVVASFPHFYMADDFLRKYVVEGIHPNKEKHGTFIELEPNTGAPLRGAKRLQINMELQKIPQITLLRPVSQGLFPIMWMEESAEVDESVQDFLKGMYNTVKVMKAIQWMIVVAGVIMLLAALHMKRKMSGETWSLTPTKVDVVKKEDRPFSAGRTRTMDFTNNAFSPEN